MTNQYELKLSANLPGTTYKVIQIQIKVSITLKEKNIILPQMQKKKVVSSLYGGCYKAYIIFFKNYL